MTYFNYHALVKNLIISGHCERAELTHRHNQISPALVLYFNNHKPMPIRKESFEKYLFMLKFYEIPIVDNIHHNAILDKK